MSQGKTMAILFQTALVIYSSNRLPEIDTALHFLSEIIHQLTNQKTSIVDEIHSTFDELQKTLNVRKSVLLMELEVNYGLKHKVRPLFFSVIFISFVGYLMLLGETMSEI